MENKLETARGYYNPSFFKLVVNADCFKEAGQPASEAEKYFNYYSATGWKVGKSKMEDWQAAARNWIIKSAQVQNRDNLRTTTYDQPL